MAIFCPACGAENPDSAKYCNLCFAEIVFEEDDFPVAVPESEGYLTKYPSSFSDDAPTFEERHDGWLASDAEVPPVDIGEYGVKSGQTFEETPES
ncbi:MAG TPA: zinc ribbon domain-containing protein [Candidatus Anoxymicrobiaceae bacterium]